MEARAKVLGHPIHQMMIVLPLGLLVGALIFDVVYLVTGEDQWTMISYWLILVGVLTGLMAAVPGFVDWLKIPQGTRAKRVGAVHGIGNVIVVVLFALSWVLRGDAAAEPSFLALLLAFAGGAVSGVTGWLGGELVGRLGVGVSDGAHLDAPSSLSGKSAAEQSRTSRRG
jgi:uncharacterized membrane protein